MAYRRRSSVRRSSRRRGSYRSRSYGGRRTRSGYSRRSGPRVRSSRRGGTVRIEVVAANPGAVSRPDLPPSMIGLRPGSSPRRAKF